MAERFFSVVIPTRGQCPYMEECLRSIPEGVGVLVQSNPDERDRHPCLRHRLPYGAALICNNNDLGLYGSINAAVPRVKGRFVHVLHDDDWTLPGFYATMQNALDALPDSVGAASCHYSNYHHETGWTSSPPPFRDGPGSIADKLRDAFTKGNPLQQVAVVFRRAAWEQLGGFREDMPYGGDFEFYARLLTRYDWWYVPANLARYRLHGAADSNALRADGRAERDMAECRRLAAQYRDEGRARVAV